MNNKNDNIRNKEDIKTINDDVIMLKAWEDWVLNGNEYCQFLTFTPINKKISLKALIANVNKVLKSMMKTMEKKGYYFSGFCFIEPMKKRSRSDDAMTPHIHIMIKSSGRGISNIEQKRIESIFYNRACNAVNDNGRRIFRQEHIDARSVFNKNGLFDYLVKTAKLSTASSKFYRRLKSESMDFISALDAHGLIDATQLTEHKYNAA